MNENTKLISGLANGEARTLVVYGTSLSFHLAPLLRDALTSKYGERITVINSGMSAKASRSGLAELEVKVLKHQPDAVLLEFAVNDAYLYEEFPEETLDKGISLEDSRSNLEQMIEIIQTELPSCEIILQTMNPTYDASTGNAQAGTRRPDLSSFYEVYRQVAQKLGLTLIDNNLMWDALLQEEPERFHELVPDGAHPTPSAIRSVLVPHVLAELGVSPSSTNIF